MKTNNNKAIFTTCHALTRAVLETESADYRTTFSACIKLYHRDRAGFFRACKMLNVSTKALAIVCNADFDIFRAMAENDDAKIKNLVNFAFYYGLKRADAFRTQKETIEDTISDNFSPRAVDMLCANDIEDVKNDIIVYLLERADNAEFLALENVYKLCKAGNCCVNKYVHKETIRACKNAFSLDSLSDDDGATDKNAVLIDKAEYYADIDKADALEYIISNLPKVYRNDVTRSFLNQYYSNHGKSGIRIDTIAERLNVSPRKLKMILSAVRDIGYYTVLNREK